MSVITSQTVVKGDPYQAQEIEIRTCPVCGSTDLVALVVTAAKQRPDGTWEFDNPTEEELRRSMKDPNAEVKCLNPFCGDPVDPATGQVIHMTEHHDLLQHWIVGIAGLPSDTELTEEQKVQAKEWIDSLVYDPWTGVIGDTHQI